MCIGEKDLHANVDTLMMRAYVNLFKFLQASFCFSRMSIQIKHSKNYVLALLIFHWLMLFKDTSFDTSALGMY